MLFGFDVLLVIAAGAAAAVEAQSQSQSGNLPVVDLGYAVQQATLNNTGIPYYNFSNIRYAAPPLGNLRFAQPQKPAVNRTLNDGQHSVICPQANPAWELTELEFLSGTPLPVLINQTSSSANFSLANIPPPDPRTSEDCLFLDVFVPQSIFNAKAANDSKRHEDRGGAPVLVWIYGGGYTAGSKSGNGNPASLIASATDNGGEGIVFVEINYRLGMFGWLSGPTFQVDGTANAGLWDQRFALEWVKENIHLFGGDPRRVTVIGESAGGGSIMHQITAFGGLKGNVPFHQAILQSPGFMPLNSNAQVESIYQETIKFASVISGKPISTTQHLRSLSFMELYYTNYAVVGTSAYGSFTFGPTVDGSFVPKLPGELLLHGQYDDSLKIMVGHNLKEGLFFSSPFIQNDTTFANYVRQTIPAATTATINLITQQLYPPVFDGSFGYTDQLGRTSLLISEVSFTCNTRFLDLAYLNKTYSYYFTVPPGLHGEDIAYTFFNGDTTTPDDGVPVNATVAKALQHYITEFTMTGKPNEPGVPFFPIYGSNSSTEVLSNDQTFGTQVTDTAANARCAFWQKALFS